MDDLFKNIKDNLENRPEPPFDERAWLDMERRLDRKPWNGAALFAWALPLALAALFLSNIFFFKKLNEANEKISNIELRADTIYQTNYIYKFDTVYIQKVETEYVVMTQQPRVDFYPIQSSYINNSPAYAQQSIWRHANQKPMTFAELQYMFADDQFKKEGTSLTDKNQYQENIGLHASPFLTSNYSLLNAESEEVKLSYLDVPAEQKKKKRPFQKLGANLQPTGFQLGVIAGLAYPQHTNVAETRGYGFGVHGAMAFSKNIRIWAEASYYKLEFKSNEMGSSLGIPEVEVPDDYEFVEASVYQPFYQYVFGLQYIFYTRKKWNPYFGVGYTFASMRPYEVSYDFEHLIDDDVELSIEEKNSRNDIIWNMFLLNGGIEGQLSKHIGLQFEAYYRWNGNKTGLLVTDILGVRGKLLYNF
jgi:hypothetical protein